MDYALFGLRLRLRPRPRPFAGASTSTSRLRHQQGPSNVSYSCSARHQHRSNPSILFDYLVNSPAPTNLSYFWSLGSLLGLTLMILIVSGLSLAMHYTANVDLAYSSVEHIMREVNNGWLLRYIHANGVSMFFIFVYLHISRNLFYGSFRQPRTLLWTIGVVIFILMMATAFIGYVLPWGQMSLWGATVITNLLSAVPFIGDHLVLFIWGGFSVDNATLNRFFSLHYLLPFLLLALVVLHLMALHNDSSNNPEGIASTADRIRFHPYFTSKDLVGFFLMAILLLSLVFYAPNYFVHPDNSITANALLTPHSIVPEWYFLPFYAILRAIPNKVLGVVAMGSALLILLLPIPLHLTALNQSLPRQLSLSNIKSNRLRPLQQLLFCTFSGNLLLLLWIGARPIAQPFILLGQLATFIYFLIITLILLAYTSDFLAKAMFMVLYWFFKVLPQHRLFTILSFCWSCLRYFYTTYYLSYNSI